MRGILRHGASLVGLAIFLPGCVGPGIGARDPAVATATLSARAAGTAMTAYCLDASKSADRAEDPQARRNRLVGANVLAIDMAHHDYERSILSAAGRARRGSASSSSRTPDIEGRDLSRALSAASAILARTGGAIESDYLRDQILTLILTQMRANRAARHAVIVRRSALPYDEWNACMALSDVQAYEQAGTVNAALAALAASADAAVRAAQPDR